MSHTQLAAKVELTVNEFLTNIIIHGLLGKYRPIVVMELKFTEDEAVLTFLDNGVEWEPKLGGNIDDIFHKIDLLAEHGQA